MNFCSNLRLKKIICNLIPISRGSKIMCVLQDELLRAGVFGLTLLKFDQTFYLSCEYRNVIWE